MDKRNQDPVLWLRRLFYLGIAGFVLSVLDYLFPNDDWTTWVNLFLSALGILCLFRLSESYPRYRKVFILSAVVFGCSIVSQLLISYESWLFIAKDYEFDNLALRIPIVSLTLVSSVVSWVSTYLRYHAHGALVEQDDPGLARKWRNLFILTIAVSVLTSVASMILTLVQTMLGIGVTAVVSTVMAIIHLPGAIISILNLVYLWRTIQVVQLQEE